MKKTQDNIKANKLITQGSDRGTRFMTINALRELENLKILLQIKDKRRSYSF